MTDDQAIIGDYVPLRDCQHGALYRVNSRNMSQAVYDAPTRSFIGLSHGLDGVSLMSEDHWDVGPPHGTVCPHEILEFCPVDLDKPAELLAWLLAKAKQYGLG